MNKLLVIVLLVFFCLLSNLQSQTEKSIPYLPTEYKQAIDSVTAFVSGNGGLYRTTDNGLSWQNIYADIKTYDLEFFSKDLGYLVTKNAVIKTTDGGKNWENYRAIILLLGQKPEDLKREGFVEITKHSSPGSISNNSGPNLITNYPNPFNPITKIKYEIKNAGNVSLKVFDISGKEVADLVSKQQAVGTYEVSFDGSNLTSGTYFYRLQTSDFAETKKMTLIK